MLSYLHVKYPQKSPFNTIPNQSKFNCFCIHVHPFAQVHILSHPCALLCPCTSMRILSHKFTSCCIHSHPCVHAHPFMFHTSAVRRSDLHVSCVAVRMHAQCRLPSNGSASLRSCPCAACGTPCMCSGTPPASCSSVSALKIPV